MAQLVVRNLEEQVVVRLRRRAAELGVSVEEAHRRVLREALLKTKGRGGRSTFKEHLLAMPDVGDDALFTRNSKGRRPLEL
jgi:plasmid stability protein